MHSLATAGRKCLSEGNLFASVAIALTLPDVLGSESGVRSVGQRYRRWFDQWAAPKFLDKDGNAYLTASDCYDLRCRLLHEGKAYLGSEQSRPVHEVQFFSDDLERDHMRIDISLYPTKRILLLRAREFSERLFQSVDEYEAQFSPHGRLKRWEKGLRVLDQSAFDNEYGLQDH
jgi:hypothetical protein